MKSEERAFERAFVYLAAHVIFIGLVLGVLYAGVKVVALFVGEHLR